MDGWLAALIGGVAGLGSGAIGSLLAPWAQWGVEKRKATRQRQLDKIADWRKELSALEKAVYEYREAEDTSIFVEDYQYYDLSKLTLRRALDLENRQWFQSLLEQHTYVEKEDLTESLREYAAANNGEPAVALLSSAIERIEHAWKLS